MFLLIKIVKRRFCVNVFNDRRLGRKRHTDSYDSVLPLPVHHYVIITCMLIALWTGRKPTLRTYEMLCWYFTGMADEDELISHIQRLQKLA